MRFQYLNESRDEKLLENLKLWYQKYHGCFSGFNKARKNYYLDFKPSKYDDYFDERNDFDGFINFAEFLFTRCYYDDERTRGFPIILKPHDVKTPNYVSKVAFGLQFNLGHETVSRSDCLDLDSLEASFDFAIALHKYIVRNCMNEKEFFYVYTQGENRRFEPAEYFNPEKSLEEYCNAEFDYRKQKPVVADGNWIRVRDEFGFLKDTKGKNFI